ncbi:Hypothetical_protein [Hexamita inflata]|uniref:Hypothetical_protein n=1 Tax=Hexamita inflata TaxID=28002 RepID=A0AA86P033_9EUKA|nr:Hypothetical protein HINF_LOCUS16100 [Hexamita inflata]
MSQDYQYGELEGYKQLITQINQWYFSGDDENVAVILCQLGKHFEFKENYDIAIKYTIADILLSYRLNKIPGVSTALATLAHEYFCLQQVEFAKENCNENLSFQLATYAYQCAFASLTHQSKMVDTIISASIPFQMSALDASFVLLSTITVNSGCYYSMASYSFECFIESLASKMQFCTFPLFYLQMLEASRAFILQLDLSCYKQSALNTLMSVCEQFLNVGINLKFCGDLLHIFEKNKREFLLNKNWLRILRLKYQTFNGELNENNARTKIEELIEFSDEKTVQEFIEFLIKFARVKMVGICVECVNSGLNGNLQQIKQNKCNVQKSELMDNFVQRKYKECVNNIQNMNTGKEKYNENIDSVLQIVCALLSHTQLEIHEQHRFLLFMMQNMIKSVNIEQLQDLQYNLVYFLHDFNLCNPLIPSSENLSKELALYGLNNYADSLLMSTHKFYGLNPAFSQHEFKQDSIVQLDKMYNVTLFLMQNKLITQERDEEAIKKLKLNKANISSHIDKYKKSNRKAKQIDYSNVVLKTRSNTAVLPHQIYQYQSMERDYENQVSQQQFNNRASHQSAEQPVNISESISESSVEDPQPEAQAIIEPQQNNIEVPTSHEFSFLPPQDLIQQVSSLTNVDTLSITSSNIDHDQILSISQLRQIQTLSLTGPCKTSDLLLLLSSITINTLILKRNCISSPNFTSVFRFAVHKNIQRIFFAQINSFQTRTAEEINIFEPRTVETIEFYMCNFKFNSQIYQNKGRLTVKRLIINNCQNVCQIMKLMQNMYLFNVDELYLQNISITELQLIDFAEYQNKIDKVKIQFAQKINSNEEINYIQNFEFRLNSEGTEVELQYKE